MKKEKKTNIIINTKNIDKIIRLMRKKLEKNEKKKPKIIGYLAFEKGKRIAIHGFAIYKPGEPLFKKKNLNEIQNP